MRARFGGLFCVGAPRVAAGHVRERGANANSGWSRPARTKPAVELVWGVAPAIGQATQVDEKEGRRRSED